MLFSILFQLYTLDKNNYKRHKDAIGNFNKNYIKIEYITSLNKKYNTPKLQLSRKTIFYINIGVVKKSIFITIYY